MYKLKKIAQKVKIIFEKLTDEYWVAQTKYIKYFDELPLDASAILLESEHGKKIDGNIYYILKYLSDNPQYKQYRIYISIRARNKKRTTDFFVKHGIDNVETVVFLSDQYMRLLASAKYLINDTSFTVSYRKKPGQIYLNTWHGTPLKNLGKKDINGFYKMGNVQKNFLCSDYLLIPNKHTQKCIIEDYMLENIGKGEMICLGYPRNEAFFNKESEKQIRTDLQLLDKRIYTYMPTFRGSVQKGHTEKNDIYLLFFLFELDRQLTEDELLYVNIHPLARSKVDFRQFKHIKTFPKSYETYEFLNIADVLITDYSSVLFDFACSGKKIILFPYDERDYCNDRGMYLSLEELPFPKAHSADAVIAELRSEKEYDDRNFIETYCPWDGVNVSQQLCDYVILQKNKGILTEKIPNNGLENVLIYAGNLAPNGITTSMRSLMNTINLTKRNYYLSFVTEHVARRGKGILTFPEDVKFCVTTGDINLTVWERIIRKLYKHKILSTSNYMKILGHRVRQEWERNFGSAKFDSIIQFNGYDEDQMLYMSTFNGPKTIFVHNDMLRELQVRKGQRRDLLNYVYNNYDNVAIVTNDIMNQTRAIAGENAPICLIKNTINCQIVLEMAEKDITLEADTKIFPNKEYFFEIINSPHPKFINIGRFAPEKGHERLINAFYKFWCENSDAYLIIMGGNSRDRGYEKTVEQIKRLGLEKNVILILRVLNPYPILKACDYFVLSSFYEGFGLVLAEADILGKPVISTDIVGPRTFMKQYGGTLIEDSEDGIYEGIKRLYEGKILPMNVDYEMYNHEIIIEFEKLFADKS